MKPPSFDYVRAYSIDEAVQMLAQAEGDGKILAGGQSLTPVLAMRLARPAVLVDINHIPGLGYVRADGDRVAVGATLRHHQLATQAVLPIASYAARQIGHAAIRSRGTFGGSLAHADPAAEIPVLALAMDAQVTTAGPNGGRTIGADGLFVSALLTSLEDDEMIVETTLATPRRWGFAELARRPGDFGVVTVAVCQFDEDWRVVIGGVGATPVRVAEAEDIVNGGTLNAKRIDDAARAAGAVVDVGDDIHASAAYRQAMIVEFTRRALTEADTRGEAK
jgi:carbon-monoxide dehydrogenase medium subunit